MVLGSEMRLRYEVTAKAISLALALAAGSTCAQEASPSFRLVNAPESVTRDLGADGVGLIDMPEELRRELRDLGLL